ncbi:MAG: FecR family protein [Sphingobacteriales bacterium]|nr:MAG: FecR family protein [Sphingobacteriales bacterium]
MKKNNSQGNDELLVKYLLGEATAEEQTEVQAWINYSVENKKYFEHFELIWAQSKKLEAASNINEDEAWERFKQRTRQPHTAPKTIPLPPPQKNMSWMRVAAAIVLLAGMAGLLYYFIGNGTPAMIALRSESGTLVQTLPDGSVVTLNKASVLTYPESFDGDNRKVTLEGEAFFNVTPNKSKPFIVQVDDVNVRVVGTSFNIKGSDEKTEVIVETGVVEVAKKDFGVKLSRHEKATVLKNQDQPIKQTSDDELYNYYRTKEFVCNGTPLWRLADVLSEAYGVHIKVSDRVKNLPITTTFSNESLDMILSIIGETYNNVSISREGSDIFIK